MNEFVEIPWLKVFSNFIWILGASITLAALSYHEFLAYMRKEKRINVFKKKSFKRPFLLGLVLIAAGISASVNKPFQAAITGSVSLFLVIWFLKLSKIKLPKLRKSKIENKLNS
ncbi:MAG: hypothetical protein JSW11_20855 [Candidatus Heimdallarchaeota archaeon]|nr:MAG: hypothetical protein JSW11_20855 [Candidatus Heimdallarchaeota archaeon]